MIQIDRPEINPYREQHFSFKRHTADNFVSFHLKEQAIYPSTHPKVVDLCAGSGGVARILIGKGWKPEGITCIDYFKPERLVVEGVNWVYWDLEELGDALGSGDLLPADVLSFQHAFNLVTIRTGFLGKKGEEGENMERLVCNFFMDPSGFCIANSRIVTETDNRRYKEFCAAQVYDPQKYELTADERMWA